MLKPISRTAVPTRAPGWFVIVASQYNALYVDSMLHAAQQVFGETKGATVDVVRVPGAFEIPVVVAALARENGRRLSGVICLGVILRGATTHAQHIGETVSAALAQIQVQWGVPVVHEVLLLENEAQARERCLGEKHNRGTEAALTALKMALTMRQLPRPKQRSVRRS